jgi:hypothetical protein
MTERKPHPDNEFIDELQDQGGAPSHGGSAGGDLQRDVGSRSELNNSLAPAGSERPRGQDHPEARQTAKGEKTTARLDPAQEYPSG